ncbi:MAG: BMP family protein [Thermogemmatispora sp.]|jgi:basic membrane protein A|uniref:BMP family protein n=1 Tax=Thermogemmatispora TaxID=768669 RepID=UPI00124CCD47|nr:MULTISPECIES: BMP family protein [Thermogemmatispora]MBE3564936.1 BMP family protein [Thermogemmatispora sp.]
MLKGSRLRLFGIPLFLLFLLLLSACGNQGTSSSSGSSGGSQPIRVAMVTSGPVNDHSWNEDALKGVQLIKEQLGWSFAYSENVSQAEQANVLRQYARQGYNLIFAHGFEYADSVKAVAPEFPNTHFVIINGTGSLPNLSGTEFRYGELGYFTGMAAGLVTKNNKIGIVAAVDAPQVTADIDTFKKGVAAVNPQASVSVAFVGSYDDVVKGQQVTQAQLDRGVDVLTIMGNAFDGPAIKLAQQKGVKVIAGWSTDAYSLAPNTIVTSGVQEVPGLYLQIAKLFKEGQLKGNTTYQFGFKEQVQHLGQWGDWVPQDVRTRVEAAVQQYLAGKLNIGLPASA